MREVIISSTTKFARMRPSALKSSWEAQELPKREYLGFFYCRWFDRVKIEDISVRGETWRDLSPCLIIPIGKGHFLARTQWIISSLFIIGRQQEWNVLHCVLAGKCSKIVALWHFAAINENILGMNRRERILCLRWLWFIIYCFSFGY